MGSYGAGDRHAISAGKLEPGELYYFAAIDEARFKRPVQPGDQMILEVEFIKERRGIARFKGIATVDGEVACDVRPSPGGLHQ